MGLRFEVGRVYMVGWESGLGSTRFTAARFSNKCNKLNITKKSGLNRKLFIFLGVSVVPITVETKLLVLLFSHFETLIQLAHPLNLPWELPFKATSPCGGAGIVARTLYTCLQFGIRDAVNDNWFIVRRATHLLFLIVFRLCTSQPLGSLLSNLDIVWLGTERAEGAKISKHTVISKVLQKSQ